MKNKAAALSKVLALALTNRDLLEMALTHRSAGKVNNERLEYLGDAVLNMIIAAELYERFPEASEGQMSRSRASLVNGVTLAALAKEIALGDYLILGAGELKTGGFARDSILAGAMEAVFGAVYLDSGFERCRTLVLQLYKTRLAGVSLAEDAKDPKTRLQEWLQAKKQALPEYHLLGSREEQGQQMFYVECRLEEPSLVTKGQGASRRQAEQTAAAQALQILAAHK